MPVAPPPEFADDEFRPLLSAAAMDSRTPVNGTPLRNRLLSRVGASRAAIASMATTRAARRESVALAPGVRATLLYEHASSRPLRPGEPLCVRLIALEAGATWAGPGDGAHREWLVMRGEATLGGETLGERDYRVAPIGNDAGSISSATGGVVFLRESARPATPGEKPFTVRDAEAGWPDFAPGIQRRVLWTRDGEAALLYYAQPGAFVPDHSHGHDEECLMVQGELYLDDLLLQAGDYQVAPAGTGHAMTRTETGVVIYAHGDLDLRFR